MKHLLSGMIVLVAVAMIGSGIAQAAPSPLRIDLASTAPPPITYTPAIRPDLPPEDEPTYFLSATPMLTVTSTPRPTVMLTPTPIQTSFDFYLPAITYQPGPAGTYSCDEYQYGLIAWSEELEMLPGEVSAIRGVGEYADQVFTGTWSYNPATQVISLTVSRWPTVTFVQPDMLQAHGWSTKPIVELGLNCKQK